MLTGRERGLWFRQATKALTNIANDPVVKLSIMDWFSLVYTTLDPMVMNRLYAIGQVRRR